MSLKRDLPVDVEPEQIWRAPDGQHYRVASVDRGLATLQRCTPGGRVQNARYLMKEEGERMQATYALVAGG